MNFSKIILSLIVLSTVNYSNPVLVSYNLYKIGDKKVLIWGVYHCNDKQVQKDDEIHKKLFFKWLSKLEKSNKLTNFLIEGSEWGLELTQNNTDYLSLCKNLPIYAKENNFKSGNLDCVLADCRTKKLIVSSVWQVNYLFEQTGNEKLFWFDIHRIRFEKKFGSYKLNDYFQEAFRILDQLKKDSGTDELINGYIFGINERIIEVQKEAEKLKIDLTQDVFYNCSSEEKLKVFLQWYAGYCDPIHFLLADIGFIIELSKSISKYDQLVLYCGQLHTPLVKLYLATLGFEHVLHFGEVDYENSEYTNPPIDLDKLKQLFDNPFNDVVVTESAFSKFYKKLTGQPNKNRIHAETCEQKEESHSCAQCNKQNCKNRCSNCKAVFYCSVSCQKDHWKTHKTNCRKN